MGQSKRTDKLRCSKCCKRDWSTYERNRGTLRDKGITWHNVHVVGKTKSGEYVKIECRTCGHRYSSRSSAAFRALSFWEANQTKKS